MDRNWEQLAAFDGLLIRQPALFMMGDADPTYALARGAIDVLSQTLPGLWRSIILPGCGHWIAEERAGEVTAVLLAWLAAV
jgi:pimeloyl-ACP methyl ester carboxylesterase